MLNHIFVTFANDTDYCMMIRRVLLPFLMRVGDTICIAATDIKITSSVVVLDDDQHVAIGCEDVKVDNLSAWIKKAEACGFQAVEGGSL